MDLVSTGKSELAWNFPPHLPLKSVWVRGMCRHGAPAAPSTRASSKVQEDNELGPRSPGPASNNNMEGFIHTDVQDPTQVWNHEKIVEMNKDQRRDAKAVFRVCCSRRVSHQQFWGRPKGRHGGGDLSGGKSEASGAPCPEAVLGGSCGRAN